MSTRDDHADEISHCATCQCAGTECQEVAWCKRTWRHDGPHGIIRDEDFQ